MYNVADKFFFLWELSLCCKLKGEKNSMQKQAEASVRHLIMSLRGHWCPLLLTLYFKTPYGTILQRSYLLEITFLALNIHFPFHKQALLPITDDELRWLPDLDFCYLVFWISVFGTNTNGLIFFFLTFLLLKKKL